jgi:hypothetical protein
VIRSLPSLTFPAHNRLRNLTFFITPEYLKWFDEGDTFLHDAVSAIYRNWNVASAKASDFEAGQAHQHRLQSRVVVVDRIPFPRANSSGVPGISLAVHALGSFWKAEENTISTGWEGSQPRISLTRSISHGDNRSVSRILLKPANTLFVNGQDVTMFTDQWRLTFNEKGIGAPKVTIEGHRRRTDNISLRPVCHSSSMSIPLQKLTEGREISMSMGNIISQLVPKQGSAATSASLELEEKVASFMTSKYGTQGTLAIFALIIPRPSPQAGTVPEQLISPQFLGYEGSTIDVDEGEISEEEEVLNHIRLQLSKGAHLHRVTSGGGGWGKKQGLLSLDPAFDFEDSVSSASAQSATNATDFKLEGHGSFWSERVTPETARPGDSVEFYGHFVSAEDELSVLGKEALITSLKESNTRKWRTSEWIAADMAQMVFGVIPPQDTNVPSVGPSTLEKIITVPHHFGMLSESGMVLQKLEPRDDARLGQGSRDVDAREHSISKIDVPHAAMTVSVYNRLEPKASSSASTEQFPHAQVARREPHELSIRYIPRPETTLHSPAETARFSLSDCGSGRDVNVASDGTAAMRADDIIDGWHGRKVRTTQVNTVRPRTEFDLSHTSPNGKQRSLSRETKPKIIKYSAPVAVRKHNAGH